MHNLTKKFDNALGETNCLVFTRFPLQVSFFAVCFIALDRYGALRFPLRYKTLITYRRSVIATVSQRKITPASDL